MTTFQRIIKYCAVAFALFLIVSIISGICSAIGLVYGLSGSRSVGEMQTYSIRSNIDALDIEIGAAELKMIPGDRLSVQSNHPHLTVQEKNGTLHISEKAVLSASVQDVTVVLTVPDGYLFQKVSMETGAGKLDITSLSAEMVSFELGAGATDIGCLNVQNRADITTGAGKLVILDGALHNLSMELGVGKLELTSLLTGNCQMEFGIGDADLTLLGSKTDYQIELNKGLGDTVLDGNAVSEDCTYGSGENRISVDGGIGSVHIRFQDSSK